MRHIVRTAVMLAALALPVSAFAAAPQTAKKSTTSTATHSVKGTVKSVDTSSLVITHKGSDMTFALDATTVKEGSPAVGNDVSVRYRTEGKTMVATAVSVQPAKQTASAKPASSTTSSSKKK
jgi:hypothetical protein